MTFAPYVWTPDSRPEAFQVDAYRSLAWHSPHPRLFWQFVAARALSRGRAPPSHDFRNLIIFQNIHASDSERNFLHGDGHLGFFVCIARYLNDDPSSRRVSQCRNSLEPLHTTGDGVVQPFAVEACAGNSHPGLVSLRGALGVCPICSRFVWRQSSREANASGGSCVPPCGDCVICLVSP